jgi:hypothetical protein
MKRCPVWAATAVVLLCLWAAVPASAQHRVIIPDALGMLIPPDPNNPNPRIALFGGRSKSVPTVYVGWLEHRNGIDMADDLPNIRGGVTNWRQRPLKGLWLSGELQWDTRMLSLSAAAATLLPQKTSGIILSNIGLTAQFDTVEDQWSYVDVVCAYKMGPSYLLVGGFRWDHTSSRLHINRPRESYDDFIVNAFLPLVGVEARRKGSFDISRLRVVGFPFVPGDITFHTWELHRPESSRSYQNFSRGYYVEVVTEYAQRIGRHGKFGVFLRWDMMRADTGVTAALQPGSQPIRWIVDRSSWTVGTTINVAFSLF